MWISCCVWGSLPLLSLVLTDPTIVLPAVSFTDFLQGDEEASQFAANILTGTFFNGKSSMTRNVQD